MQTIAKPVAEYTVTDERYMAYFHELDAWTEYWDIYHPETAGHYYFGDDKLEPGLLTKFLPRNHVPPVFTAWTRMALGIGSQQTFEKEALVPDVLSAIIEIDKLLSVIFANHFGNPEDRLVQQDYLTAIFRFATDTLPPAFERDSKISIDDPRKATAGRHTLAGDIMWFAWALQIEASKMIIGVDQEHARRTLMLAGIAIGCPAHFAWTGHRRTKSEYLCNKQTEDLLYERGLTFSTDFEAAAKEISTLFRIREWGEDIEAV